VSDDYTVARDSSVYYKGSYWNDLDIVRVHLNHRATDDPNLGWYTHAKFFVGDGFDRALILNCGNGWVERDLFAMGTVRSAVGIDISHELLQTATETAGDDPLTYHHMDINTVAFPAGPFDAVINHAAGHHIAYIDRVLRSLQNVLPSDGHFVSWDYVGPHRNQYGLRAWRAATDVNNSLPPHLRSDMSYPHLQTMIIDDPTEAIHPELYRETLERYFEVKYERILGGAIAYVLLTFNQAIHTAYAEGDPEAINAVKYILQKDAEYTDAFPEDALFSYLVAQPRSTEHDEATLTRWTTEEDRREANNDQKSGIYYDATELATRFYPPRVPNFRQKIEQHSPRTATALRAVAQTAKKAAEQLRNR
jgi:SAM-dependent methyltransferase